LIKNARTKWSAHSLSQDRLVRQIIMVDSRLLVDNIQQRYNPLELAEGLRSCSCVDEYLDFLELEKPQLFFPYTCGAGPLFYAVMYGNAVVAEELIVEYGFDPNAHVLCESLLQIARRYNDERSDVIAVLLEAGAD